MNILILCPEDHRSKELWGYAPAFRRQGVRLMWVEERQPANVDIGELVEQCPAKPSLVLQPESNFPLLPLGLAGVSIPTACFQIDTFAYTRRRIRWIMLFDYAIVFHPGFDDQFRNAGHFRPCLLCHAASRDLFDVPERERVFEVGWVGSIKTDFYKQRRRVLEMLAGEFRMNEWRRAYPPEEMADVYLRSKVVVNVARDDYLPDSNMRAFEAMGGGALLVNRVPTELTAVGFEEGTHFVGYRAESEIVGLVRHYLTQDASRRRIAEAGRAKVLREHTYDCRVRDFLNVLRQDRGRLYAPARQWTEEQVRLAYVDYYAARGCLDCALEELPQIARRSLRAATSGAALIARGCAGRFRSRVRAAILR